MPSTDYIARERVVHTLCSTHHNWLNTCLRSRLGKGGDSWGACGTGGLGRRRALKVLSSVVLVGCAAWISRGMTGWQRWTSDFATATGERRSVQLPDGTRLQLNSDSTVYLTFNPQQRLITLVRGEIQVTCGSLSSAPLLVHTRHGLLEGIDGRFTVSQDSECTRLSVVSGNVVIHSPQTADGLIVTRDMRQADLVSDVERYRQGYLGCAADIGDLRLSGVFRLDDTDKLLTIVAQTLPVQVRYRTRWWVSLERLA